MEPFEASEMLVSKARNRTLRIDGRKTHLGAFFTEKRSWLHGHVLTFIRAARPTVILDPFAGNGDLLRAIEAVHPCATRGLDCAPRHGWELNDSLLVIPALPGGLILTNPPYLAKYSAKRKGVLAHVAGYYANSTWDDLYLIALERCLEAADAVVAILPETFINSGFPMDRVHSITILEQNPFTDTECPACVVCLGKKASRHKPPMYYKDAQPILPIAQIEALRLKPTGALPIHFNAPHGLIGLRAVDLPSAEKRIAFLSREAMDYAPERIKASSRLVTYLELPTVPGAAIPALIARANALLEAYRTATHDIPLSPFKGNTKRGTRRRRLDYATARAILELAAAQASGALSDWMSASSSSLGSR